MEIRFQNSPKETASMQKEELRKTFVCENLMQDDKINLVYSHYDRMIVGGVKPVNAAIELPNHTELREGYFLQRREIGIIKNAIREAILDGEIKNDYDEAYVFMIKEAEKLGLKLKNQPTNQLESNLFV